MRGRSGYVQLQHLPRCFVTRRTVAPTRQKLLGFWGKGWGNIEGDLCPPPTEDTDVRSSSVAHSRTYISPDLAYRAAQCLVRRRLVVRGATRRSINDVRKTQARMDETAGDGEALALLFIARLLTAIVDAK